MKTHNATSYLSNWISIFMLLELYVKFCFPKNFIAFLLVVWWRKRRSFHCLASLQICIFFSIIKYMLLYTNTARNWEVQYCSIRWDLSQKILRLSKWNPYCPFCSQISGLLNSSLVTPFRHATCFSILHFEFRWANL